MIEMKMRMRGMDEVRAKFRRLPSEVGGKVLVSTLRAELQPLCDAMVADCPREPPAPDMADSLGVVTLESMPHSATLAITNRPSHKHGWLIRMWEWGTSRMPGKPIMRPVWDRDSEGLAQRLVDRLWDMVIKALKKNTTAPASGGDWR